MHMLNRVTIYANKLVFIYSSIHYNAILLKHIFLPFSNPPLKHLYGKYYSLYRKDYQLQKQNRIA